MFLLEDFAEAFLFGTVKFAAALKVFAMFAAGLELVFEFPPVFVLTKLALVFEFPPVFAFIEFAFALEFALGAAVFMESGALDKFAVATSETLALVGFGEGDVEGFALAGFNDFFCMQSMRPSWKLLIPVRLNMRSRISGTNTPSSLPTEK